MPVTCFTMALTTFVSQNLGAKQYSQILMHLEKWRFSDVDLILRLRDSFCLSLFCRLPVFMNGTDREHFVSQNLGKWQNSMTAGEKGSKIWGSLFDHYCRIDRRDHICCRTGADRSI